MNDDSPTDPILAHVELVVGGLYGDQAYEAARNASLVRVGVGRRSARDLVPMELLPPKITALPSWEVLLNSRVSPLTTPPAALARAATSPSQQRHTESRQKARRPRDAGPCPPSNAPGMHRSAPA